MNDSFVCFYSISMAMDLMPYGLKDVTGCLRIND